MFHRLLIFIPALSNRLATAQCRKILEITCNFVIIELIVLLGIFGVVIRNAQSCISFDLKLNHNFHKREIYLRMQFGDKLKILRSLNIHVKSKHQKPLRTFPPASTSLSNLAAFIFCFLKQINKNSCEMKFYKAKQKQRRESEDNRRLICAQK